MKKYKILSIFFILTIFCNIFSINSFASTADVIDNANLLTRDQKISLENTASNFANKYNIDVVLLTYNDSNGKSTEEYTDDFYDGIEGNKQYSPNGILFAINMNKREIYVNTIGTCNNAISNKSVDKILNEGYKYAKNKQYANTLHIMMTEAFDYIEYYYNTGSVKNPSTSSSSNGINTAVIFYGFILSVALSIISRMGLVKKHNKGNEIISAGNYIDKNEGYLVNDREDNFLKTYTAVTRGYYSKNNSTSRGGSSHRSSSGRRHGGGGRRF